MRITNVEKSNRYFQCAKENHCKKDCRSSKWLKCGHCSKTHATEMRQPSYDALGNKCLQKNSTRNMEEAPNETLLHCSIKATNSETEGLVKSFYERQKHRQKRTKRCACPAPYPMEEATSPLWDVTSRRNFTWTFCKKRTWRSSHFKKALKQCYSPFWRQRRAKQQAVRSSFTNGENMVRRRTKPCACLSPYWWRKPTRFCE